MTDVVFPWEDSLTLSLTATTSASTAAAAVLLSHPTHSYAELDASWRGVMRQKPHLCSYSTLVLTIHSFA